MAEQDPLLSNSSSSSSSNSELPGSEERQDGGEKKRRLDDVSEESGSRRPRILQSAIAAVVRPQSVGGGGVVGREEQQQGHAPKAAAIAALQEAQTKPEAVSRNKRMLSSLLGHLGQAKRNLERDSSVIERQATRAAAAIERNRTDSERVNKLNADKSKEVRIITMFLAAYELACTYMTITAPNIYLGGQSPQCGHRFAAQGGRVCIWHAVVPTGARLAALLLHGDGAPAGLAARPSGRGLQGAI